MRAGISIKRTVQHPRIIGGSSNFLFSGDPIVSSPLHIDGSSPVYRVTLNVIPVTTKMEGLVVDRDGDPLEDVRIHLSGPYKVTYKTRSRVYDPKGEIRGYIRDKFKNSLERATIEVATSQGETFTYEVGSPYHIEDLPVGEITVTAICPGGGGRQSRTVRLACDMTDSEKADTDFVLDCDPGTLFHINHSGIFSSEGAMYNIQASAGAEFTLSLPDGQTEAEIDVVYTVEQHLKNNPGGAVRILSITPQSFVLTAVLRWRVEKSTNRDGVDEYTFGAEVIDRETAEILVVTQDRDEEPVEWNMEGVGNAVDLCFPQTWFQVRKGKDIDEFPFSEKSEFGDSMPQALIGISQTRPDAPKFDDSDNQVESKIRIDMRVRSKD